MDRFVVKLKRKSLRNKLWQRMEKNLGWWFGRQQIKMTTSLPVSAAFIKN
jgi:hypothetical protein